MDASKLDYASIIEMYRKAGNEEKVQEILKLALDNYKKIRFYSFLEGLTISDELLERYKNNQSVLVILAKNKVEPKEKIEKFLAAISCFPNLIDLTLKGIISPKYLEDFLVREKSLEYYNDIFGNQKVLKKLGATRLVCEFRKIPAIYDESESYPRMVANIIINSNVSDSIKEELVKELIKHNEKEHLSRIIGVVFNNHASINFENYVLNRGYLTLIVEYFEQNNINPLVKGREERYSKYCTSLIEKIKQGIVDNIAWAVYLHRFNDDVLLEILNYWAKHDKVLEFENYFGYFYATNKPENIDRYHFYNGSDFDYAYKENKKSVDAARTRKPE